MAVNSITVRRIMTRLQSDLPEWGFRKLSFSVDIDPVCRGGYRLERRHPDARASASVQNHRSPLEVSMRVWS